MLHFAHWFYNLDTTDFDEWMLVGDFNYIIIVEDRNKTGGSVSDRMVFNNIIQDLDVVDVPFEGRHYTWSNMQDDPLLEKLDWVFISTS